MGMLKDKIVLVTNVSHFVGTASAKACRAEGATVICHDESFADMFEQAKFEEENSGLTASSAQDPEDLLSSILATHDKLDVLVSNDFYPAIRAPVDEAKAHDMREGLEALVVKPFLLAGHVASHMKEVGGGRMLFVTSAAPLKGLANYSMYATARGAANAMVISLARELSPNNILVNAIAPNYVESPSYFPDSLLANPEALQKITKNIPLGRLGKPEEVAAMVTFFASDKCGFITGHILPIAGGWA